MDYQPSVLVVDDEPHGFKVIHALLKPENYALFYVSSGAEALTQLDSINPDVILLDLMMPDMDGIEVCQRIKADTDWKHVPIIMVTALDSKNDLARCLDAGADDFISKPVNRVELCARVRSMLRIKQQYDALRGTMQLREEMSDMMVHDLRNPVTTVLLGSHFVLAQNLLQGKALEKIQMINAAGQRLNSMINDLLMMAKMESGKLLLNRTAIDLNTLVEAIVTTAQEVAGSKNVQLATQLPDATVQISADANLLHRAIDNLLANAIKFSPQGGRITVRIESQATLTQSELGVSQAKIQVLDEGPGVKPELQEQIFKKYETGDAIEGASQIGLGLCFCKRVAEAHNGKIYVQNNEPKGAIFTLEI